MLETVVDASVFHERSSDINIFHFIFRKNCESKTKHSDIRWKTYHKTQDVHIDASINICPLFCYQSLYYQSTSRT